MSISLLIQKRWRIIFLAVLLLFLPWVGKAQTLKQTTPKSAQTQAGVPIWGYAELEKNILKGNSDTTYILNFWATWCKPCVEELPAFERLTKETQGKKVRVILLSLDFKKDISKKLIPFLRSRGIISRVILFSEPNADEWINRISQEWSGAIPVTLVINAASNKREFYEKQLSYEELSTIVQRIHSTTQ